jgi:hypothetical protein
MCRIAIACVRLTAFMGLVALIGPRPAEGQSISFGFSTGHHHHHRHHWHDHCYGPRYRPWVGLVYAPPPVIHERVIYVEPPPRVSTTIVTGGTSLAANNWTAPVASSASTNPPVVSTPVAAASDARITIRNGAGVQLPVAFLVDGQDFELPDGEARSFVGSGRRTVQYDRGGRFGSTQHDLSAGDYEFRITASGWDLVRRPGQSDRSAVRPNSLPNLR